MGRASVGHQAGNGIMDAVAGTPVAVAEEVLEHLELAVHRLLVPAVALIAVGEHLESRQGDDQLLETIDVHEAIMPGDDDEGPLRSSCNDVNIVTPQAVVQPLSCCPRIGAPLVLVVDVGGPVVDVALDDHEALVQIADPALTAEPYHAVPHRTSAQKAHLISISSPHEIR